MGVDYCAAICVGYRTDEIRPIIENIIDETEFDGDFYDWLDDSDLKRYSTSYDDSPDLIGLSAGNSGTYSYDELNLDSFNTKITAYSASLVALFDIEPKVYLTVDAW